MRWTVIFLFCVGAASAKYMNPNGLGRMIKSIEDLEEDFENTLSQDWNDEDMEYDDDVDRLMQNTPPRNQKTQQHKQRYLEDSDDEDLSLMNQQMRHQQQQPQQRTQQQKRCPQSYNQEKQPKQTWNDEADMDLDSEDEDHSQRQTQKQKQQKHRQQDREDEQGQCKPNYQLLQHLEQTNAQLAAKLHKEAKDGSDDKNTVVSPVAVQMALAAIKQGARGDTKRQISQLLAAGISSSQEDNAHAALIRSLKGEGPDKAGKKSVSIKSSTNIILSQQSAQEQFVQSVRECFDGEVKRCDFRNQPHQCRNQINQFVTGKMEQKVQQPLARNSITGNTKMISIGTMQLKANWAKQFRRNQGAAEGRFYPLGDQQSINVKTMQTEGDFNLYEDNQLQVLGVQTQDKQLTMYVILPKERNGLNRLEKQRLQSGKQLQQLLDNCDSKKQTLKVQLPLFQAVHKMDSKRLLRKLGVENAFDADQSDFSGIVEENENEHMLKHGQRQTGGLEDIGSTKNSRKHQMHFNKFIQQATIQINENGIDAATGNSQQQTGAQKQSKTGNRDESKYGEKSQKQFQADHPFVFVVKHNPSKQMLLIGRVVDPSEQYEQEKQEQENDQD